jgi:predicted O-methyltransferase YrrM
MNEFEDKIISKPVTLMPGPKIEYLIKFIDRYKPKKILEVGSFAGGTTFTLAKKFPDSDIISIDNHHFILQIQNTDERILKWVEEQYKIKLTFDIIKKIHIIYERHVNNLKFKTCVIYDLDLKKENFDFIIYDGDHSIEETYKSLKYLYENIQEGIILVDDCVYPHINEVVDQVIKEYNAEFKKSLWITHDPPFTMPASYEFISIFKNII